MPRKKAEETTEETTSAETISATEENSVETPAAETAENAEKPKRAAKAKNESTSEDSSIIGSVIGAVSSAASTVAETVAGVASTVTDAIGITGGSDDKDAKDADTNRAQRIGVVTSDKMTKTVVVRVDRLVKHPKYRRYVRRKKQFMAHDEMGATIGDKVRIIETRPLSARKRWRVVEIVQKAAK